MAVSHAIRNFQRTGRAFAWPLLALVLLAVQGLRAADDSVDALSASELESRLAALQATGSSDPDSVRLADIYRATLANLNGIQENRNSQAKYERLFQEAPGKQQSALLELQDLQRQTRSAKSLSQNVAIERLERLLRENRERQQQLQNRESALQQTASVLSVRTDSARAELKAADNVDDAEEQSGSHSGEGQKLILARRDELQTRRQLRSSLVARLETEIRTIPERLAAVQSDLKLVTAQREQTEKFLAELLGLDTLKRIAEAEKLREQVTQRIAKVTVSHPEIAALVLENKQLADEYVAVITRAESIGSDLGVALDNERELSGAYKSIKQQLSIASLNDSLGPLLMEHYLNLIQLEQPSRKLRGIAELLASTRLRQFQIGEMLTQEVQLHERVYRAIETGAEIASNELFAGERAAAIAESDRLMSDRNTLLESLNKSYLQSTEQIVDLDTSYQAQADVARRFRELLDRNLIWMTSHRPLGLQDALSWPANVWRMLATQDWSGFANGMLQTARQQFVSTTLIGLSLLVLFSARGRLRAFLAARTLRSVGWASYHYSLAMQSLLIHLVLALPLVLLLLGVGWIAGNMDNGGHLGTAVSAACYQTAILGYGYLVLREAFRAEGFTRQHLRWKAARVQAVERWLSLGLLVVLPAVFFTAFSARLTDGGSGDQSYRVTALLLPLLFLGFALRIGRAGRGMFNKAFLIAHYPLLGKAARLLLVTLIAALPLIVMLGATGYHFTAQALQQCTLASVLLLIFGKIVIDTGLLGITLAARRSMAAQQELSDVPTSAPGEVASKVSEWGEEIDWERMNASAVALLHVVVAGVVAVSLMALWGEFFRALEVLDSVALWHYQSSVDGKETTAILSLFDLGRALVILALGMALAKGLPSLIGIVFYGYITEKGVLFAIQTVLGYALIVIAVMITLQALGFGWSKLQWMAAGLSVGVGFGLQAIFANFFSGLIMLFERPVRIGDVITLGEFSGTIQRIRIRATTIMDFDNREIIVPNQMFVTERLINWTLSSSVVRMSLDVGISYDADPRLARQLLLDIMAADERVLQDPPPSVVFREFGASSLNLRCFAHVVDVMLRFHVQNDLHMRINEVFREHAIRIAYPQMDIHLHKAPGAPTSP